MTTAAELLAQTDCADLRKANESLQRQNDILTGRVHRLNAQLELRDREITRLVAELAALLEIKEREAENLEAQRVKLLRELFECDTIIAARNATVAEYETQIQRQAGEIARLNETCDRIARAGMRDAGELPY